MNGEGRRPPAAVALEQLVHNPFNPREALTDLEETAASLRAKGQIQPVTVVRTAAFLAAHPGQEEAVGAAEYVVIDGNRRLAAAHQAALAELRIDVNDDLAATAADILESALIANVHRVDVPPLDQAKAIQELVQVHGSQGQVAKRLGKTPAWVSQRLALLELTPELQEKVETGELKVEPARRIGRLPKEQREEEAQKALNAVKTPRQRQPKQTEDTDGSTTLDAVNTPRAPTGDTLKISGGVNAVNSSTAQAGQPGGSGAGQEEVAEQPETGQPKRLPYDNPPYIVHHLHKKMDPAGFVQGARVWMQLLREEHPEEYSTLLKDLVDDA